MKKNLLCMMLLTSASAFAAAPQTGFYLSGINGETSATANNTLTYVAGDAEDEEEGIYRFINEEMTVNSCESGFVAIGIEGMKLGYDAQNIISAENMINDYATIGYLTEGGPAYNCQLTPGTYKVILASYQEDETVPMTWSIMFTSLSSGDNVQSYYLLGFNNEDEPSQSNMFIREEEEDEEGGEPIIMYTFPKFYISETSGFWVADKNFKEVFGAMGGDPISDEMPFAIMVPDGAPVASNLTPGYYTVNFSPMGAMGMISFLLCEDQTPADQCTYYLTGFGGDPVKFERIVEKSEYVDEETGETITSESINYVIEKVHLTSCPDGFLIESEGDQLFTFGLNLDMAAFFGDTVSEENSGIGFLGIYGNPIKWNMAENDYTVTFFTSGTLGNVTFTVYGTDNDSVEGIEAEDTTVPVYYNLQGQKVVNPDKGIFIRVTGNKVEKIVK
ncbi:MAG: hypothetical protein J1E97_02570 [Muribaculaceae bacterium]|nr:hypothetical protein [Muribaculaceae bacterium]